MIQLTGRQEYIAPNRCKEVIMQLLAENAEEHERMLGGIKDWEIQDEEIFEEDDLSVLKLSSLVLKSSLKAVFSINAPSISFVNLS